jgi:hypothetical protein
MKWLLACVLLILVLLLAEGKPRAARSFQHSIGNATQQETAVFSMRSPRSPTLILSSKRRR